MYVFDDDDDDDDDVMMSSLSFDDVKLKKREITE